MNETVRPDPDALLERIRAEEPGARRARLKVFFGATAGVGKTYAMLVEAHERLRDGVDVVVGLVETHGRRETGVLLEGLEVLARKSLDYRGAQLAEFDLDAALARRPGLLLLDELAHTNVPGSRHRRRWQDVEELLDAGIDVYTTLNVQHVESLVDVVAQITGVTIRETVPDSILDRADEVELVDLPPDDLLQRLREGKVYLAPQAERALEGFFRKGNLIALRELALRQTAARVDAQMESYRRAQGIRDPWAVRDRMLVCIGDPESGLRLVRAARRMATALRAEWIVVHVETPGQAGAPTATRDHIVDLMGLAEELGAETAMLSGLRVADEILAYARTRNVSRVVLGRSALPRWRRWLAGSLAGALMRGRGEFDVLVLRGEDAEEAPPREAAAARPVRWRRYAGTIPILAACTVVSEGMRRNFDLSNLSMTYLLGVVVAAMAFGRGPAIFTALLGVVLFDFLFVPPRFTLAVSDTQYGVTFLVMAVVGVVIGTLTARMRGQTESARARERRTAALYQLSRDLAGHATLQGVLESAASRIGEVFEARVAILLPDAGDRLAVAGGDASLLGAAVHEIGVAQWAFDHAQPAGLGTETLPASHALHLPLQAAGGVAGVIAVRPADPRQLRDPERIQLLRTFANHVAVAVERARLGEEAEKSRVEAEAERTRSALLSSVSHDLRTPLAVITGAASGLRDGGALPEAMRRELAETISEEAERLNRLVGDLLEMTRLESGAVKARREWHSLEEIVGSALFRLEDQIGERPVRLDLPRDLPLVPLDDVLFGQLVFNLVENALKHTPPGTPIDLSARLESGVLGLDVADRGPGFPPGEEAHVFDKFYRGAGSRAREGVGLGLTICRAIARAHDGTISASNRPGGGALFHVEIPAAGEPPVVEREASESPSAGSPS